MDQIEAFPVCLQAAIAYKQNCVHFLTSFASALW